MSLRGRAGCRTTIVQGDAVWRRRVTSGGVEGLRSVDLQGEAMERRRATWGGHAG